MNKYFKILLAATVVVGFTSCLKDKEFDDNVYGLNNVENGKIIELALPDDQSHDQTLAVDFVDEVKTVNYVTVRLASKNPATEDITVTLDTAVISQQLIDAYNDDNGTDIVKLPNSFVTYPATGLKVTIPAGSREAYLKLTFNPTDLDPSTTYAIGFKILSVDKPGYDISGNFNTFLTLIGAKNKYDGVYNLRVRMTAPGNDRPTVDVSTTWNWGGPVSLITTGGSSNDLFDDYGFGQVIQPIHTNVGVESGFGSTAPRFVFDPSTDQITDVINTFPNPSNGRAFQVDPNKPGRWDAATGNVYAHFIMTQSGFQPLLIADTLFYVGPR